MSTTATEPKTGWSMGLSSWAAQIANLTAVALICLMFYQDRQESLRLAREDRELFRESIKQLSETSAEQWRAIRALSTQIRALTDIIKERTP